MKEKSLRPANPNELAQIHGVCSELLTCRVGDQWLGISVSQVQEVVSPMPCTSIPLADTLVTGLINLRGRVISQLNIRLAVGLPASEDPHYRVAIVETDSGEAFGLMIDEVGEVIKLVAQDYEKTPKSLPKVWQDVSDGVLKRDGHVLVLMNVDSFIALTVAMAS
ncbi:MAG: chemotaxis protein CheW [Mariprofundus sp.]|nr:chemotaxis protein CheW [Mariprofundus sp.]